MATKQDRKNQHFASTDEVLSMFSPLGVHAARRLIANDPRFPAPVLGGHGPGSRAIYSLHQVESYLAQVHRDGFPPEVAAAVKEGA